MTGMRYLCVAERRFCGASPCPPPILCNISTLQSPSIVYVGWAHHDRCRECARRSRRSTTRSKRTVTSSGSGGMMRGQCGTEDGISAVFLEKRNSRFMACRRMYWLGVQAARANLRHFHRNATFRTMSRTQRCSSRSRRTLGGWKTRSRTRLKKLLKCTTRSATLWRLEIQLPTPPRVRVAQLLDLRSDGVTHQSYTRRTTTRPRETYVRNNAPFSKKIKMKS